SGRPEGQPLDDRLMADGPAVDWVRTALAGSEVLDGAGRVLRRASGAILLSGIVGPSGPLRRRAELATLADEVARGETAVAAADREIQATAARLAEREQALAAAMTAAEQAREAERQGAATREDASRVAANLAREMTESEAQLTRVT